VIGEQKSNQEAVKIKSLMRTVRHRTEMTPWRASTRENEIKAKREIKFQEPRIRVANRKVRSASPWHTKKKTPNRSSWRRIWPGDTE
jgi:hypothetical protein